MDGGWKKNTTGNDKILVADDCWAGSRTSVGHRAREGERERERATGDGHMFGANHKAAAALAF